MRPEEKATLEKANIFSLPWEWVVFLDRKVYELIYILTSKLRYICKIEYKHIQEPACELSYETLTILNNKCAEITWPVMNHKNGRVDFKSFKISPTYRVVTFGWGNLKNTYYDKKLESFILGLPAPGSWLDAARVTADILYLIKATPAGLVQVIEGVDEVIKKIEKLASQEAERIEK
jgi:hypothetical protein